MSVPVVGSRGTWATMLSGEPTRENVELPRPKTGLQHPDLAAKRQRAGVLVGRDVLEQPVQRAKEVVGRHGALVPDDDVREPTWCCA
jgi:hypothetical protein